VNTVYNKPSCTYVPSNKVPAVTYGGPIVPPDEPSPESDKITESLVLLDFIADLSGSLLPKDVVLRAKARFFIDAVNTFVTSYHSVMGYGEPVEKLLASIETIQALLPEEGFVVGTEFSIADAAVIPFFARMEAVLKNDIGAFDEGTGLKAWQTYQKDEKYAKIRKYIASMKERESFKKTFDEKSMVEAMRPRLAAARAQRKAKASQ